VECNRDACDTLRLNKQISTADSTWFEQWFSNVAAATYGRWETEKVHWIKQRIQYGLSNHTYFRDSVVIEDDIRNVSSDNIMEAARVQRGEVDLVAGGPPCQSFSRSGQRKSVDDERGQLFLEFVRVVNDLKPRWFLFENVKGLILTKTTIWKVVCNSCGGEKIPPFDVERVAPNHSDECPACELCGNTRTAWRVEPNKRAGALEIIISEFERIGYTCKPHVLNAADYGAPQLRERLFIFGTRDNEVINPPMITHYPDALVEIKGGRLQKQQTVWDALFTERNPNHHWPLDPEIAVLWVKNVVRPHDEPVIWTLLRPSPTIGAHQSAKLAIAPYGVPPEQLARQQWHVLGRRQGDTEPVTVEHTYLADSDLLKLQTFPDFWFVSGTRMERAFQIGNAVPPKLAGAVARAFLNSNLSYRALSESESYVSSSPSDGNRPKRQLEMF
jgi:DNA (cytosine-5)-methyltransferase 1